MNDLISRSELKRRLTKRLDELKVDENKGYAEELYEIRGSIEAIEYAISEIESIPSAYSWISCKQRMPETNGYYFVIYDGAIVTMFFELDMDEGERWGYWHNYFHPDTLEFLDSEFESIGDEYISHWLPIPELP